MELTPVANIWWNLKNGMEVESNKSLKELTTFRIGGNAKFFCVIKNEHDILEAVEFADGNKIPFFILGGGSNILISDEGFPGLVAKMEMRGIDISEDQFGLAHVTVKAGEDWDEFVGQMAKKGFYGLENLSLIPGTVGAAPVQNIGAYGSEVRDTIDTVRVFDTQTGQFINMTSLDCHFQYRDSIFKKSGSRYIIASVTFILKKNGRVNTEYKDIKEYLNNKGIKEPSLLEVRDAVVAIRTNKLPDVKKIGTAGSFFKNPIVGRSQAHALKEKYPDLPIYPADQNHDKLSLAWVIDHICEYKGVSKGNVGTYKNQALVIVNNGKATAKEIKDFANEISQTVKEKTGIQIEPEVQYIG